MSNKFLNKDIPVLEEGVAHIWAADFDQYVDNVSYLAGLLDSDEVQRMNRKRHDIDKQRYAISHGLMRVILGRYLGIDPQAIHYQYGPYGKPVIDPDNLKISSYNVKSSLEFNMSDSGNILLIGISCGAPIGVDIERHREIDIHRFSRRFYTKQEADYIEKLPEDKRTQTFFKTWTCKEAYVKGWGYGITANVGKMEVSIYPSQKAELIKCSFDTDSPKYWDLLDIPQITGYSATVAIRYKNAGIIFDWITIRTLILGTHCYTSLSFRS